MAGRDVTAMAIGSGRVLDTGDRADLLHRYPGSQAVGHGNATIVPGFNDAHMHPGMASEDLLHADASPERVQTRSELLALLHGEAARTPPGQWVRATRYDHMRSTGGQVLDRADLDAVSREHPILLVHVAAHWGVTNSAGLRAGGYDDRSPPPPPPPPPGGELGRDGAGRLNGVLYEQALFDYCDPAVATNGVTVIPESGIENRLRGLARFTALLHAAGLTSVTDALSGPADLRLFSAARRRGSLGLRVSALLGYPYLDRLADLGITSGFGDEWLRIGGVKAFADGAVAGRTCLVEQPFEGSGDHGIQVTSDDDLRDLAARAERAGCRLAVHANGDRAIAKVLAAIEAAQQTRDERSERAASDEEGTRDTRDTRDTRSAPRLRHRIEHCSIITPEIVATMARLGVVAVPFGSYVAYHGEKLLAWYGAGRLARMFAHRTLLDAGVPVAGSSDYPCGPCQPLLALQSCVTRESADGTVLGGAQRITPREALALYTTGAAFASGEQDVKGRLAPGYLADFTVLDEDPLQVDPRRLGSVGVRSTWVAGERVWQA